MVLKVTFLAFLWVVLIQKISSEFIDKFIDDLTLIWVGFLGIRFTVERRGLLPV